MFIFAAWLTGAAMYAAAPATRPAARSPATASATRPIDLKALKVTIAVRAVTLNGTTFTLPIPHRQLIAILGRPDRVVEKANAIHVWDRLGLYAHEAPGSGTIKSITVALAREPLFDFSPKNLFAGTLMIDGAVVTAQSDVVDVNRAKQGEKFERQDRLDSWVIEDDDYFLSFSDADPDANPRGVRLESFGIDTK